MAGNSFADWRLSSSENEEETQGILLKVKRKRLTVTPKLDTSTEEYVPLLQRLKMRGSKSNDYSMDDNDVDLPVFDVASCSSKDKDRITTLQAKTSAVLKVDDVTIPYDSDNKNIISPLRTETSPGKRKIDDVIVINDDALGEKSEEMEKFSRRNARSADRRGVTAKQSRNIDKPREVLTECRQNVAEAEELSRRKDLKSLKPEECMKHMECLISPLIIEMFEGSDFVQEIQEDFEASCIIHSFSIPCVRWRRRVSPVSGVEGYARVSYDEPEVLVVISATEFVRMVDARVSGSVSLTKFVKNLRSQNLGVNIHLVCYELEKYQKNMKSRHAREVKRKEKENLRRKKVSAVPDVSSEQIEESLVDLQIENKTTFLCVEKREELVRLIKQLTKSVAEAPYKRMKRQDVQFINEIPSVKVNSKSGEGTKKAWKQMIQQFHNVTPVMASAIVDKYPSLLSLVRAYEECGADLPRAESLLAEIPVRRGVGTLQTRRRIGPELSYKIYRLLMSTDGDERLY